MKEWQLKALEYRDQGLSSRKICDKLGWKRTQKSVINYFFQRHDIEHQAAMSVFEGRLKNDVVGVQEQNDYTDWKATQKPDLDIKPKVLFYDIETSLAKSYHFGQWKQNLSVKQQIQEGHLLSHAWAWGDGDVVGSILTREEVPIS